MDRVDETLRMWRMSALIYGQSDCMLSIGDYIAACGGKDVTGLFRGRYTDEPGALAQMASYGGATGLVDLTGLTRCDPADAQRGDVFVLDTGTVCVGAICTGAGVAARLARGVVELNRRLVILPNAWKITI